MTYVGAKLDPVKVILISNPLKSVYEKKDE